MVFSFFSKILFSKNRRGDANIWWIVIGAVIALVVLIILMLIFTGKTTGLEKGLSDCQGKGGVCAPPNDGCPSNSLKTGTFSCDSQGLVEGICCIGSPKKCESFSDCCDDIKNCECKPNNYEGKSYCYSK